MSNIVFPTLLSSSWKMSRTPQWKTTANVAITGDTRRAPLQTFPLWKWNLKNGILQTATNDLQAIQGLYNTMYGRLDWFLWPDPEPDSIPDVSTLQINVLGALYWPVAFTTDSLDFDRFAYQLWELGEVEFEQVFLPSTTFGGSQLPHGGVTVATLNVLTSYTRTGWSQPPAARLSVEGPEFPDPGGSVFTNAFMQDSGTWSLRTNSLTLTPTQASNIQSGLVLYAEVWNTLASTGTAAFSIFDVSVDVSYADATGATLRPAAFNVVAGANGDVLTPGNAVDGDSASAAVMERTQTSAGLGGPVLILTDFV